MLDGSPYWHPSHAPSPSNRWILLSSHSQERNPFSSAIQKGTHPFCSIGLLRPFLRYILPFRTRVGSYPPDRPVLSNPRSKGRTTHTTDRNGRERATWNRIARVNRIRTVPGTQPPPLGWGKGRQQPVRSESRGRRRPQVEQGFGKKGNRNQEGTVTNACTCAWRTGGAAFPPGNTTPTPWHLQHTSGTEKKHKPRHAEGALRDLRYDQEWLEPRTRTIYRLSPMHSRSYRQRLKRMGALRYIVPCTLLGAALVLLWNKGGQEKIALQLYQQPRTRGSANGTSLVCPGCSDVSSVEQMHITRAFIVGCGHSGTTLLYRTVGNLPGMLCRGTETGVFINPLYKPIIKIVLTKWDVEAYQGGYQAWVEKTPKHINKIRQIETVASNAKFIFIYRDGRDVVRSLIERGYTLEKAVDRWVQDNQAMTKLLPAANVLSIRFEDFTNANTVLGTLEQLCHFLHLHCSELHKLLALQGPGDTIYQAPKGVCTMYPNDTAKFNDLEESLLFTLGKPSSLRETNLTGMQHGKLRRWQVSQPWQDLQLDSEAGLDKVEADYFWARKDARELMGYFGYSQ